MTVVLKLIAALTRVGVTVTFRPGDDEFAPLHIHVRTSVGADGQYTAHNMLVCNHEIEMPHSDKLLVRRLREMGESVVAGEKERQA